MWAGSRAQVRPLFEVWPKRNNVILILEPPALVASLG
jgi:hypothetical protein